MATQTDRHTYVNGPVIISPQLNVYRPVTAEDVMTAAGAPDRCRILAVNTAGLAVGDIEDQSVELEVLSYSNFDLSCFGWSAMCRSSYTGDREYVVTHGDFTNWVHRARSDWPLTIYMVSLGRLAG